MELHSTFAHVEAKLGQQNLPRMVDESDDTLF